MSELLILKAETDRHLIFLTTEEIEGLNILLENEINSTIDFLEDVKGEVKEYWKGEIEFNKQLKEKLEGVI